MRTVQYGMMMCVGVLLTGGCATGGGGGGGLTRPVVANDNSQGDLTDVPDDSGGGEPTSGNDDGTDGDVLGGGGSDGGDGGGSSGGDGGSEPAPSGAGSAVVKTQIVIGYNGKIDVGDDLIVYGITSDDGTNQTRGVHYLIPSRSDNQTASGTMIPGSDRLFGADNFKVAGRKVALVRSTGAITVFDADTGRLVDIPLSELTLDRKLTSDGPYIAAINNIDNSVLGGYEIAVIDVSGADPVVLRFPEPEDLFTNFDQVVISAKTRRVVAIGDGSALYVWDLDAPNNPPVEYDFDINSGSTGIDESKPISFDGDYVLYVDEEYHPNVSLLNVNDGTITVFDDNPTSWYTAGAVAGGSFAYFINREEADEAENGGWRSAIGRIEDAPSATLASQLDYYDFRPTVVDEPGYEQDVCLYYDKLIGYGGEFCITPDGRYWFLAGGAGTLGVVDSANYVQVSRGGAFSDIPDPEQTTYTGSLMGRDIVCSADTVAFRGLREVNDEVVCSTSTYEVVSFIRLNQFDQ